jgi:RNA polymerase sigma-54 factor
MKRGRQTQRLETKLRLVLTKKLIQSLDILVLPVQLLVEFIEKEAEDNPFIEFDEQEGEIERERKKDYLTEEIETWLDIGSRNVKMDGIMEYTEPPDTKKTLQDYLLGEISLIFREGPRLDIAKEIIYSLDESGWLGETPNEIAKRMGVKKKIVLEVLEKVKELEPAGIAASDLRECLLIQLKRKGEENTLAFRILSYAYDYFLSSYRDKLARKFAVSEEDIENALKRIYKLDPLPGRHLCGEPQYVYPDVVIEHRKGASIEDKDDYVVSIPNYHLPRASLSPIYRQLLENPDTFGDKERNYLMEKFQRAKNLLMAIEQRKETIRRIAGYIKDKESRFLFEDEPPVLITEKEVAQHIGVNVSTVSRAIKDKWIETPKGMSKFSYFFSHGRMEDYHWVISFIQDMVRKEDKKHPLSDESIVKRLKKQGFNIARTTVVKYRKILGIPSSSKRKTRSSGYRSQS